MKWLGLVAGALSASCLGDATPPGSEVMGTYHVRAEPSVRRCELAEVSAEPFDFETTVSRDPSSGQAWLTLLKTTEVLGFRSATGYSRGAAFDGQVVTSAASAQRVFADCSACETELREQMRLTIFSLSQSEAVGNRCPADAIAPPPDDDAGVKLPGFTGAGYDAVRVCGVLTTSVHVTGVLADAGVCPPRCGVSATSVSQAWGTDAPRSTRPCSMTFTLTGERQ